MVTSFFFPVFLLVSYCFLLFPVAFNKVFVPFGEGLATFVCLASKHHNTSPAFGSLRVHVKQVTRKSLRDAKRPKGGGPTQDVGHRAHEMLHLRSRCASYRKGARKTLRTLLSASNQEKIKF